jgi:hypothetical protein
MFGVQDEELQRLAEQEEKVEAMRATRQVNCGPQSVNDGPFSVNDGPWHAHCGPWRVNCGPMRVKLWSVVCEVVFRGVWNWGL